VRSSALSIFAVITATAWIGCSREQIKPAAVQPAAMQVRIALVQRELVPTVIEIPGIIRPAERATIAAHITGTIDLLPLTLGQTVKHGDLLAHLNAPELAARLARARALLARAEREEARDRDLASSGADTEDTARAAEETLLAARAAATEAEAMLAYTEIRAPYDGRIAQKLTYPGDLATPGSPLLQLERASGLQVESAVPASLAPAIKIGADFVLQISGVATPTIGRVSELAAAADANTHTVLVKLDLVTSDTTWSGRAVRVQLQGEPAEALLVPTSAVTRFGQMERVFVEVGGKAQLRLVKTGATRGDHIELLAGIASGESIVVAPPTPLRDGQRIVAGP